MRKLFALFFVLLLSGCGLFQPKPDPVVRIEHVLVAPADNLLVNCDVAPPPAKADYLQTPGPVSLTIADASTVLAFGFSGAEWQTLRLALKKAEAQLDLQTRLNLKHYQNVHACNQRWATLREWKANAEKALINRKKE